MSIEKNISRIFEEIDSSKNFIIEVLSGSDKLFGGTSVRIPSDGSHAGQSGWASGNAWDIFAPAGTPVYSISDGVATTFNDYGPRVIATADGKKLFGQGFTVETAGNIPNLFYTHLQGSTIGKGSQVKCGQLLGYIMDFPGGSDHVHIGVESGSIKQFLNGDGTIKCASGQEITGTDVTPLVPVVSTGGEPSELTGNIPTSGSEEFEFFTGTPDDNSEDLEFFKGIKERKISENIKRIKNLL